ncbi:MAG: pyridoxal phosphate-dependent aminotransferase [Bacteroidetes bacterium]|nr:pyridoxal phosphate-dependent aminotransferase [Bacteroidota bacterium]
MKKTPIDRKVVDKCLRESGIINVGEANIRQIRRLINSVEEETGHRYIRLEMGIPGLKAPQFAIEAEKEALDQGCASQYPAIDGHPALKFETSRFIKNFLNVFITPRSCIPTVGSINGAYATFMVAGRRDRNKDTVLFIDPGFPVHKQLVRMIGLKAVNFDVYNYRSELLHEKLESYLSKGNISTIIYSNPNNPSWICFNEQELRIIGELANKYDVVVAEDLAYFAMDFRKDLSTPGKPPYQATVARFTEKYVLLISTSKIFSYAGQRTGLLAISDTLFDSDYPDLLQYYMSQNFGYCLVYGTVYNTTAGCTHTTQHAVSAILKEVNEGRYRFLEDVREYGERAKIMKKMFLNAGFKIVYDKDIEEPIADGFYFTICYPGINGEYLTRELLYYGISTISLSITGSDRKDGVRICVSLVSRAQFPELEFRLNKFHEHHKLVP